MVHPGPAIGSNYSGITSGVQLLEGNFVIKRTYRLTLSWTLLLSLVACVPPPPFRFDLGRVEVAANDFTFPSGLRILFQVEHTQPVVSVAMVIDAGSADDPKGQEGVAHLVEHLWFRSRRALGTVHEIHHQFGASANAATGPDETVFVTDVAKGEIVELLKLEAQRLVDPLAGVTKAELDAEREVVRNELRLQYENTPWFGLSTL